MKKPTEVGSEEGVSHTKKKKGDKADIANVFQSAIGRSGNKQLSDFAGGIFAKANMSRTKATGHHVEAASDNEDDDEEDGSEDEEEEGEEGEAGREEESEE